MNKFEIINTCTLIFALYMFLSVLVLLRLPVVDFHVFTL